MISLSLHEPDWNSEHASELHSFLMTATGQRLLEILVYRRPAFMSSTSHPHKSFANSREVHGYEVAIKTLLSLLEGDRTPTAESETSYPDLDDDSKWPQAQ